jgi:hypothetical protein
MGTTFVNIFNGIYFKFWVEASNFVNNPLN